MHDRSEWSALYGLLIEELAGHGLNDPFGDGDFYLIDDDYGSKQQKIEFTSAGSLAPALVVGIQRVLASFPEWEVIVAMPPNDGVEHGFRVTANACIEHRGA